jgi:hypothetical protein
MTAEPPFTLHITILEKAIVLPAEELLLFEVLVYNQAK